jgi:hypothetical protein
VLDHVNIVLLHSVLDDLQGPPPFDATEEGEVDPDPLALIGGCVAEKLPADTAVQCEKADECPDHVRPVKVIRLNLHGAVLLFLFKLLTDSLAMPWKEVSAVPASGLGKVETAFLLQDAQMPSHVIDAHLQFLGDGDIVRVARRVALETVDHSEDS